MEITLAQVSQMFLHFGEHQTMCWTSWSDLRLVEDHDVVGGWPGPEANPVQFWYGSAHLPSLESPKGFTTNGIFLNFFRKQTRRCPLTVCPTMMEQKLWNQKSLQMITKAEKHLWFKVMEGRGGGIFIWSSLF